MGLWKGSLLLIGLGALALGIGAMGRSAWEQRAHIRHPHTGAMLTVPGKESEATLLFNGWRIRPIGRKIATGDMLLGGAISPDGKMFAIANAGYDRHAVHLIDVATEKEFETFPMDHAWNGIAWAPDSQTLYVAGGASHDGKDIVVITSTGDRWERHTTFTLVGGADAGDICVAGLALSPDGRTLYALNMNDGHLYLLDADSGETRTRIEVGDHPVVCRLTPDGKQLFVANWGGAEVVALDVSDPRHPAISRRMPTGAHPNDIVLSSDHRLFVSCANADAVTMLDARTGAPLEVLKTTLTPRSPSGSTPDALALSHDNKTLYVANADNNAVCVLDVSVPGKGSVRGFLPTGWYPSALALSADGKKLIVCSGKGTGSHPNAGITPEHPTAPPDYKFEYIGRQLNGLIAFVDMPSAAQLAQYTRQVFANAPYHDSQLQGAASPMRTAIPNRLGDPSPIKHVLYIIKENRTYDQVFGDVREGNGDPNLCLFGQTVTPNEHALAHQFVLLDNIYCNGEVSQDGHPWCDGAIATDYTERSWVLDYSGKGGMKETEAITDPAAGYLWDACQRNGLTYRSYGEALDATSSREAPVQKVAGAKGLLGHGSEKYVGIGWPDDRPMRDTDKADIFIEEFREFERTHTIPQFMVMSLGEDHTSGTRPGTFTPIASVASNDQALGKIVEAISHSSAWKEFAIFVIEDDAQNGPDHVDSHRTVSLVLSPYVRRQTVDSTMYSTASIVHTMELILGLPPLTQYDAAATPMFASFTDQADLTPYTRIAPQTDLLARNPRGGIGATASAQMDFRGYDRADPDALNRVLWESIKGRSVPMPPPVHSVATRAIMDVRMNRR